MEADTDARCAAADARRADIMAGIHGLRQQLTDNANARADGSVATMIAAVEASIATLAADLAARKQAIDDESVAVAKRIRDIADIQFDDIKEVKGIEKEADTRAGYDYGRAGYGYGARAVRGKYYAQTEVEYYDSPFFNKDERTDKT
jgi:hypothetical protein